MDTCTGAFCLRHLPQAERKMYLLPDTQYEQEQKGLQTWVVVLRETFSKAKAQRLNIDSFLALVRKYTEVKELNAEIIRTLVERIDVFKPGKVPGTRTKKQTILIHWNFIGAVELPQEPKKSA